MASQSNANQLAENILRRSEGIDRFIVAIAGAPCSGKSTLTERLVSCLNINQQNAAILQMDGFHYDNSLLMEKGWMSRKGASHTFDVDGFRNTLSRIKRQQEDVCVPIFDRNLELSRACACIIKRDTRIVIVEGNYLLLDTPPWSTLKQLFDFTVFIEEELQEVEKRSIARWLHYGFNQEEAKEKTECNDLLNAKEVISNSIDADLKIKSVLG